MILREFEGGGRVGIYGGEGESEAGKELFVFVVIPSISSLIVTLIIVVVILVVIIIPGQIRWFFRSGKVSRRRGGHGGRDNGRAWVVKVVEEVEERGCGV